MSARRRRRLIVLVVVAGLGALGVRARSWLTARVPEGPDGVFLVRPYVQLGDAPRASASERLDVLWQADDRDHAWSVERRPVSGGLWTRAEQPQWRGLAVAVEGFAPRRLYRATLSGLGPGAEFAYRVVRDRVAVFEARARARKPAGQSHRFVAFGDGGVNSAEQKAIAYQALRARPDYVAVAGDLVYFKGRASEYLSKFFPIYNAEGFAASLGAPLLRSTLVVAAPGNHDLLERNLDASPDALAYFYFWSLPLNGPIGTVGAANTPNLKGTEAHQRAFLDAAGESYPRMASYSFDYGDVHWTVLDTNPYADWTAPALRDWLARDLAAARGARWRFVMCHQPPFHSSKAHSDEQRTRLLVALLEEHRVDLVISGHVHNYQRSYPLKFVADESRLSSAGHLAGHWTLDKSFDGATRTKPDGIIYLVTGAGGARLYDSHQHDAVDSWQPYTAKFLANTHSLTVVDVTPERLTVRQVSDKGVELDRFAVTH